MREGGKPEGDRSRKQTEQEQGNREVPGGESESFIEPGLPRQDGQHIEAQERAKGGGRQHFRDVLLFEVADLMREDRFEFRSGQLLNEGIEEHNLAKATEPSKEGVRVARTLASVHYLNAAGFKAGVLGEFQQSFAQAAFGQRREFVE